MNTRALKYETIQESETEILSKTSYKGQEIQRIRGKDKYGPTNNTCWTWNGIWFGRLNELLEVIDERVKL